MNEKIKTYLEKAEKSGAYFITITYRDEDKDEDQLRHLQVHTPDFLYQDLLPTIDKIKEMIHREYPGLKYIMETGS